MTKAEKQRLRAIQDALIMLELLAGDLMTSSTRSREGLHLLWRANTHIFRQLLDLEAELSV